MGTSAEIAEQLTSAFTDLEKERIREILSDGRIYFTASSVNILIGDLTGVQIQATRQDIADWDALGQGTEAVRGGKDGIDYSAPRDRSVVRNRLARRLGADTGASDGINGMLVRG